MFDLLGAQRLLECPAEFSGTIRNTMCRLASESLTKGVCMMAKLSAWRYRQCAIGRVFCILLWALHAESSAQDVTFTPQHVAKLRSVTAAEIAPDGSRVAYVLSVPRVPIKEDDGPAWAELHVVTSEGISRPYVTGNVNVSALAWHRDGAAISFLAKRGKEDHAALYVIPIDGGEAQRVLVHKADITGYSWSPDGKRVAFLATEPVAKEKKELKDKGFSQQIYEEDWQPVRLWLAAPDDKVSKPKTIELPGSATHVHWSPIGNRLAVTLAPTPLVDDGLMNKKVHVVDVESGKVIARIDTPGKLGQVAWSPDGKHLAMISAADRNDPQEGRLMTAPADGGTLTELFGKFEGHVTSIAWRSSEEVAFTADEGVASSLRVVSRDNPQRQQLHVPAVASPFVGLSLARDGKTGAWIEQGSRHPPEVFLVRLGETTARRLTDSNPWLAHMRFAPQEVVTHKARDGLDLEGILVRPLGAEPGRQVPLILAVHGGPEAHVSNGWVTSYSNPGQVAAARGFAVFYPNYRGSTGRGVAFSKLGQADAAGKEFDDLIDAVDHLAATGLIDKTKVGITGGSYGGYASAWGATYYSDRFAASVMFVGLSDLVSKAGTSDIPNEMHLVHHLKHLWDDWDYFRQRSPIYHVQKARTPLLILHGKDDPRVHPSQSLELYRQLKVLGRTPVRLVFYPGEGHGNRRACSRLDYNLRMIQWMEHYLMGSGGSPPPFEIDYGLEKSKAEAGD
jgi:dipeptidyl aminopeptidase/acylaminoacyl peptidase